MFDILSLFFEVLRIACGVIIGSIVGAYVGQKILVKNIKKELLKILNVLPKDLQFYASLIKALIKEVREGASQT